MPETKRERYERIGGALKQERSSFDSDIQELADYFLPRRPRMYTGDRNKGGRRSNKIINSTCRFAARTLQAGMLSGMSSPARPWMKLTTPDQELMEFPPVKEWLHKCGERMRTLMLTTNLYNVLPLTYGDMGVFATAAMGLMADDRDLLRAYSYPAGSYWLGMDFRNVVNTFYMEVDYTVDQVVEMFAAKPNGDVDWSNVSTQVKDLWEKGSYQQPVTVAWLITPNRDYMPSRAQAKYKKFASCWWELGNQEKKFLKESGFDEFPIMAPRWEVTGNDIWGTDSPGYTALGDNKQLQSEERTKGKGLMKMVDPPLVGPASLRSQKVSLVPGDITYLDAREGMQGLKSIHETTIPLRDMIDDIAAVEYRLNRAFFVDLFQMLATMDQRRGSQPPTAREIDERHEEKLLALGPVLERTNDELFDPMVDRFFGVMYRAGLLPTIPRELEGVMVKAQYISILAEAQKLVGLVGQDRFLQSVLPLGEMFPEARAKVNIFQVVNNYQEMTGTDPRVLISDEEARAAVAEQAQQQRAAMQAEQMQMMARGVKDASQAQLQGGGSALDRVSDAVAAQVM